MFVLIRIILGLVFGLIGLVLGLAGGCIGLVFAFVAVLLVGIFLIPFALPIIIPCFLVFAGLSLVFRRR